MNSSGVVPRRASYLVFASVWAGKRKVDELKSSDHDNLGQPSLSDVGFY